MSLQNLLEMDLLLTINFASTIKNNNTIGIVMQVLRGEIRRILIGVELFHLLPI